MILLRFLERVEVSHARVLALALASVTAYQEDFFKELRRAAAT